MRKLTPKELEIGMITVEPVMTPLGQELAPAGTVLTRQMINHMKLYRVEYALVEGEDPVPENVSASQETETETPKLPKTHAQESKTHVQKVACSDVFRCFQVAYFRAIDQMKVSYVGLIERNEPIDTDALLSTVSELYHSRSTIVELFDMIYNMRTMKDAVYSHCLNVGLISRMIGRWLKFEKPDLNVLTLAGLMHDIGKLKIPSDVLEKPDALSDEEFSLIRQHPKFSYEILRDQPLDDRIKNAALMHHERCDGSGYPSGLGQGFIDNFAMIVAIADVYDAMTATRSYRAPLCPFQVINIFEQEGFQKYDTRYILTFLKQIATSYQSNRVMLSDGRGCNIVMLNQNALSRPIVQFDDNSCLDLSTASKDLFIKAVV